MHPGAGALYEIARRRNVRPADTASSTHQARVQSTVNHDAAGTITMFVLISSWAPATPGR